MFTSLRCQQHLNTHQKLLRLEKNIIRVMDNKVEQAGYSSQLLLSQSLSWYFLQILFDHMLLVQIDDEFATFQPISFCENNPNTSEMGEF